MRSLPQQDKANEPLGAWWLCLKSKKANNSMRNIILTENILNIKKSYINGSHESRVLATYFDKQYKQDSMEKGTL